VSQYTDTESLFREVWKIALQEVQISLDLLSDALVQAVVSVSFSSFFRRIPIPPFVVFDPVGPALRAAVLVIDGLGDFFNSLTQIPLKIVAEVAAVNFPFPGDSHVLTFRQSFQMQLFIMTDVALRTSASGPFSTVGVLSFIAVTVRKMLSTIKFFSNPTFVGFFKKIAGIGTPVWARLYQFVSLAWRFSVAGAYTIFVLEMARQATLPVLRDRLIRDFTLPQDSRRVRIAPGTAHRHRLNLKTGPDQG